MRSVRRATIACVGFAALSAGCMALPFAGWQAHEFEGELAPNPIHAVEDGRRVTFAQVSITQREESPYDIHPRTMLVEVANPSAPADPPTWAGKASLRDHPLLGRLHDDLPLYRRPDKVGITLEREPTLIPWNRGYVVATRPFAVAFPITADAFATAQSELARGELSTRETTIGFMESFRQAERQPGATEQQYNQRVPWVEPGVLSIRVDTVEILADADTLRVVRLKEAMTVDALLNVLASPEGIEPHVAEEIRQPRTLPLSIRDSAVQYPNEYPRL